MTDKIEPVVVKNEVAVGKTEPSDDKRLIHHIMRDLRKPIPPRLIKHRKQGGAMLDYIEWHTAANLLDFYARNWSVRVVNETFGNKYYVCTVEITIHAEDGDYTRQNVGHEELSLKGYGDPFSNAFAMAFKRAAALFGLGRHLYTK